jgi:hypothetical protein
VLNIFFTGLSYKELCSRQTALRSISQLHIACSRICAVACAPTTLCNTRSVLAFWRLAMSLNRSVWNTDISPCFNAKISTPVSSTITQNEVCNGVPQPWQGDRAIRASIIVSAITFPIIALRFISRIYITHRVWWDDWAILVATVSITYFIIQLLK